MNGTVSNLRLFVCLAVVVAACAAGSGGCAGDPEDLASADPGIPTIPRMSRNTRPGFTSFESRLDGAFRLTASNGIVSFQNPCFSPDGRFLVINRFDRGYNRGPAHLLRLDQGIPLPPQLTSGDQDDVVVPFAAFDRTTGRVVFASDRDDASDFWTVNPTRPEDPLRLTTHGKHPMWIEPVFSPSGTAIAFEEVIVATEGDAHRARIVRMDLATKQLTPLTNPAGDLDDRLPSWSPDGTQIVFQRRLPPDDKVEAYLVPATGGAATNLSALTTKNSAGDDSDLSWSHDGRYVVSSAAHNGIPHPSIFLLPVNGGPVIRATSCPTAEDGAACCSPDGAWIAFESHTSATRPSDIWIIRSPLASGN